MRFAPALALLVVVTAVPARAREVPTPDQGWWVVLTSAKNTDGPVFKSDSIKRIAAAARKCGFEPFNDFSMKFTGVAPGYDVSVLGLTCV